MQLITQIYRSTKKEGAYLYVPKDTVLTELPAALMRVFGKGELAMTLLLTPSKKLAAISAEVVLAAIEEHGFYLQLPPLASSEMQALAAQNSKISHG